ncbi:MAG: major facilitator transporter [Thermoplasmatales archaeon A-plasma]|nr:MAG: major facilitator transporter [Thermoplasmatales archaeon A-plasma]
METSDNTKRVGVGARLDRLPSSNLQRLFISQLGIGVWFDLFILFTGGPLALPIAKTLNVSKATATFYVAAFPFIGAFLGSIIYGILGDRYGRRITFLTSLLGFGVFSIISAFSTNIYELGILRFVSYLSVGGEIAIVDTYVSEFITRKGRGNWLSWMYTLAWTSSPVGALLVYLFAPVNYVLPGWRWVLLISGIGGIAAWLYRFRLYESPRWLESHGKIKEADETMDKIEERVMKMNKLTTLPPAEYVPYTTKEDKMPLSDLFKGEYKARTVMIWILQFLQGGMSFIIGTLAPLVLVAAGFTIIHSLLFTVVIDTGYVLGSLAASFVLDRYDRKAEIIVFALLLGLDGFAFSLIHIVGLILFFGTAYTFLDNFFNNSWHIYQAEIYPTRARTTGTGAAFSLSRIGTFIFLSTFVVLLDAYGAVPVFSINFMFGIIIAAVVFILGPKTTGKVLELISK